MITTGRVEEVREAVAMARREKATIGCVPTMGGLHAGHVSLLDAARDECDFLVATLFVNPTQFNDDDDFARYPRPVEVDLDTCRQAGVDLLFRPECDTVYPPGDATMVEVGPLGRTLEGHSRPGHFPGVATVVIKLLNIVVPDAVYFGQKDYQQQLLVRRMCRDLHLPIEVRTCPTIREPDGLALSSRNQLLSPDERRSATALWRSLELARDQLVAGERELDQVRAAMRETLESEPGVVVDYATLADPETLEEPASVQPRLVALIAATVGSTRLIDNLPIELDGQPIEAGNVGDEEQISRPRD